MFKIAVILSILMGSSLFAHQQREPVVCIHGFMGAPWNMAFLKKELTKQGWNPLEWGYASRERLIEEHAQDLVRDLQKLAEQQPCQPIHFVTHSMGGLVLLAALNHPACPQEAKIGKVVLITPPAKGSEWGRQLGQFKIARKIAKNFSGKQLMTKADFYDLGSFPSSLQGILVIAGNRSLNPFLRRENDGTVAVEETYLSTPHQHVVINQGHRTILFSKKMSTLVTRFLQDGN